MISNSHKNNIYIKKYDDHYSENASDIQSINSPINYNLSDTPFSEEQRKPNNKSKANNYLSRSNNYNCDKKLNKNNKIPTISSTSQSISNMQLPINMTDSSRKNTDTLSNITDSTRYSSKSYKLHSDDYHSINKIGGASNRSENYLESEDWMNDTESS